MQSELIERVTKEEVAKEKYKISASPKGYTKCNFFVYEVCRRVGYADFRAMLANQIVKKLWESEYTFLPVTGLVACAFANKGFLVLAGWENPEKAKAGHVSICVPGKIYWSPQFKSFVPNVANVGRTNFSKRPASYAFGKDSKPSYFVWIAFPKDLNRPIKTGMEER